MNFWPVDNPVITAALILGVVGARFGLTWLFTWAMDRRKSIQW